MLLQSRRIWITPTVLPLQHWSPASAHCLVRRRPSFSSIYSLFEPSGLDRGDGNRPDGITLFPCERGKSLVLDATCTDMLCPSNVIRSAIQARAAANEAESRKRSKYAPLTDGSDFQPIAVETSGMFGESTLVFLRNLGSYIASAKGDVRERT